MEKRDYIANDVRLMQEWDWDKNNSLGIFPEKLTGGSIKVVWWKCKKCHYGWSASPNRRTSQGSGCPVCANKVVIPGYNDLATKYPEIAKRWHPTLNTLKPTEILPKSNRNVYWICEKHPEHCFTNKVCTMVVNDTKCPICANQKVFKGFNDLATTHPSLIEEWDFDKNTNISPDNITYGKNVKVWWKCKNGHSWKATVASRAGSQKVGCPKCKKELFISFPEKAIAYYLAKVFSIEENRKFDWLGNSEIDIYLPEFNLGIEYDGQAWHKDFTKDLKKDLLCEENGVQLIRVRESLCPEYESTSLKFICEKQNFEMLADAILHISKHINEKFDQQIDLKIDINADYYDILAKMDLMKKENSVANSDLIKEWDFEKNKGINPETVQLGTHKKFWWICNLGHEWKSAVYSRVGEKGCGCPYCAGQKVITGWNDLKTLYPNIANEWNYKKNVITPEQIRPNTNKKYWWKCSNCDYEWETPPSHRVSGKGCPKCARERTIASHFKKVRCLETKEVFNSLKEASEKYNLNRDAIGNCCRRISKTAGGYHWEYIQNIKKD